MFEPMPCAGTGNHNKQGIVGCRIFFCDECCLKFQEPIILSADKARADMESVGL